VPLGIFDTATESRSRNRGCRRMAARRGCTERMVGQDGAPGGYALPKTETITASPRPPVASFSGAESDETPHAALLRQPNPLFNERDPITPPIFGFVFQNEPTEKTSAFHL